MFVVFLLKNGGLTFFVSNFVSIQQTIFSKLNFREYSYLQWRLSYFSSINLSLVQNTNKIRFENTKSEHRTHTAHRQYIKEIFPTNSVMIFPLVDIKKVYKISGERYKTLFRSIIQMKVSIDL